MKEYLVEIQVTGTYFRKIEAEDERVAEDLAMDDLPEELLDSSGIVCVKRVDVPNPKVVEVTSCHTIDDGN